VRVAWLGPMPTDGFGVAYAEAQLLAELAAGGVEVDCYVTGAPDDVPRSTSGIDGLRFVCEPVNWDWGRWYSRSPLSSFVTGQAARAAAQRRLLPLVVRNHAARRYDALLQFSQIEFFVARPLLTRLPPLVLYPSVHAAGELRWHRRESALARTCEPAFWHLAARTMLAVRSARQRRDIGRAKLVIALSRRFGEHLQRDYGVPPERIRVVPYPIDLDRFSPGSAPGSPGGEPLTVVFASRMSVRKGVEMVVALSHRLTDLVGRVRIEAVGGETLWSRYASLLDALNGDVATYQGHLDGSRLAELFRRADLLLQPSHYEPFALTVGEALASGVPVVASDEVGAAEDIDRGCCSIFPAGDLDTFERLVRELVARLDTPELRSIKALARSEAERLFAPSTIAARLIAHLEERGASTAPKRAEVQAA
jgi:glycosyltransferase involved in cell wall biosynthesis